MLEVVFGTITRGWRSLWNAGIENMQTIQIRALVFKDAGFWCAQCLEHDIAVQGHSIDELISELTDTLAAYVELATEEGKEPFAGIPPAPSYFFEKIKYAREMAPPMKTLKPSEAPQIVPTLRVFQNA